MISVEDILWVLISDFSCEGYGFGILPPPKVIKYADPYHETLVKSRNSSVILGIAVLRMV